MRRFRKPLIATGVGFAVMVLVGIIGVTAISNSSGSNREKTKRAEMLGSGTAVLGGVIIAPFWLYTAYQLGQERRKNRR